MDFKMPPSPSAPLLKTSVQPINGMCAVHPVQRINLCAALLCVAFELPTTLRSKLLNFFRYFEIQHFVTSPYFFFLI